MRCIIFANGEFNKNNFEKIIKDSLIIAADGGAFHCIKLKILPDILIGDFDSISKEEIKRLKKQGVKTIQYPVDKDKTDLELALQYAKEKNADEIVIFDALGGRWDMTVSNIMLVALPELREKNVRIIDGNQEISLISENKQRVFSGSAGDIFSLIPLTNDVLGVTISGLKYPLTDGTLKFGSTMGISNVFTGSKAMVSIKSGLLLCFIVHTN
mmetsp:Transcript_12749/g.6315  ORF Transcript_12749/g.6315 Transcript_12749/m.6315 type:complete len:213 (+) Transcript_12749:1142-1780(+)